MSERPKDFPGDAQLSALYREHARDEPSVEIDERILAAARAAVTVPVSAARRSWWQRWRTTLALTTTLTLTLTLALLQQRQRQGQCQGRRQRQRRSPALPPTAPRGAHRHSHRRPRSGENALVDLYRGLIAGMLPVECRELRVAREILWPFAHNRSCRLFRSLTRA